MNTSMLSMTRESLIAAIQEGYRADYLFFWGHTRKDTSRVNKTCFSQWYESPFEDNSVLYPTAEHYMMARKALLFNDEEAHQRILHATDPKTAKKIGREIRSFDPSTWDEHKIDIVVTGNTLKFQQHEELQRFLLSTGQQIIVEASPFDQIWGVGLREQEADVWNPTRWNGENLLGFALMTVRERLLILE